MRLWIDDLRLPPDGWSWAKTADEALTMLKTANVVEISFDHDLGGLPGTDAIVVAQWLEEQAYHTKRAPPLWHIHSGNPVGRKNIQAALESAERLATRETGPSL